MVPDADPAVRHSGSITSSSYMFDSLPLYPSTSSLMSSSALSSTSSSLPSSRTPASAMSSSRPNIPAMPNAAMSNARNNVALQLGGVPFYVAKSQQPNLQSSVNPSQALSVMSVPNCSLGPTSWSDCWNEEQFEKLYYIMSCVRISFGLIFPLLYRL